MSRVMSVAQGRVITVATEKSGDKQTQQQIFRKNIYAWREGKYVFRIQAILGQLDSVWISRKR